MMLFVSYYGMLARYLYTCGVLPTMYRPVMANDKTAAVKSGSSFPRCTYNFTRSTGMEAMLRNVVLWV